MEANQNKYLWALAGLAVVVGGYFFFSDKPKGVEGTPAKSRKRKAKSRKVK